MARRIIAPALALVAALVKQITGVEIPQESLDTLAEAALIVAGLVGVFLHPKD